MKLPIVYSPAYDMTMMGLERLHPFDSAKYSKVFAALRKAGFLDGQNHHVPPQASEEMLLRVHGPEYLKSLRSSLKVAQIAEVLPLRWLPNFFLQRRLLRPMRYATAGSVVATGLAMQNGWAINLGGGFHHAKANFGSGFCFFADINIAAAYFWDQFPQKRILVVDLDAHQGNGFAHTFGAEPRVTTFDMYNGDIYPNDHPAKKHVRYDLPLRARTGTEAYMKILHAELPQAITASKPDLIIYNAGSDIYEADPLGALSVSAQGVVDRDAFMFELARTQQIPIVMLLSGGYIKESAALISRSILNLRDKGLIGK